MKTCSICDKAALDSDFFKLPSDIFLELGGICAEPELCLDCAWGIGLTEDVHV